MNKDVVQIKHKVVEPLKIGDKIFKSAYDWELTKEDFDKAARELGETEDRKREGLRKLKEKLSNDLNVSYRQDDPYLLRYLRVRKYDVQKAYQNIRLLKELRNKHSILCTIPPDLMRVQQLNWYTILPYTDEEGRIIILLNFNRWKPTETSFEEIIAAAANMYDILSMNPKCQINGIVDIWNLEGLTIRHISELLWDGRLKKILHIGLSGYPWRIKKVIVLHTNRFVRFLFNMIKPQLQKKMADRCVLLGSDLNELHQHVNPLLLPKRLKGSLEEEECDVSQHVLDNLPYLRYERSFIFG